MSKEETDKLINDAAIFLAGGHDGPAVEIFKGALRLIEKNNARTGDRQYENWIACLDMLAEVCKSVAKLARAMAKR